MDYLVIVQCYVCVCVSEIRAHVVAQPNDSECTMYLQYLHQLSWDTTKKEAMRHTVSLTDAQSCVLHCHGAQSEQSSDSRPHHALKAFTYLSMNLS